MCVSKLIWGYINAQVLTIAIGPQWFLHIIMLVSILKAFIIQGTYIHILTESQAKGRQCVPNHKYLFRIQRNSILTVLSPFSLKDA